jgi:hypothetical protein
MKKTLLFALCSMLLLFAASAPAQSLQGAVFITADTEPVTVATTKLFTLEKALNLADLDVVAFAGYNLRQEKTAAGFAALYAYPFAKNAYLDVGPALTWEAGRKPGLGIVAALRLARF